MNKHNRSIGQVTQSQYAAIAEAIEAYYDGLYRGDTTQLARSFHSQASYMTASGGEYVHIDMDTYFDRVRARESPMSQGSDYGYVLESISIAGPEAALVRLRSSMLGKRFDDFLSLAKIHGEWRIVAKLFHHEPEPQATQE